MDFPLYFQKVMLLWQGSIAEIDYGFFIDFGPYFIEKSLGTFKFCYLDFAYLSLPPSIWSKVMAILINGWILPTGGDASGRVCACSLHSGLVYNNMNVLHFPVLSYPPWSFEWCPSSEVERVALRPHPSQYCRPGVMKCPQCTALHCTGQYYSALHCTVHNTTLHYTALYGTLPLCSALHRTVLHCIALHCTALHCTELHCTTALHCTALHCTALHCTACHCTALHWTTMQFFGTHNTFCSFIAVQCTVFHALYACCGNAFPSSLPGDSLVSFPYCTHP